MVNFRFLGAALIALLSVSAAQAADKLPALHADPTRTSVSGLSSGAFMAVQYDVAFSASTMGIGVVAGGPYDCVYANIGGILACMTLNPYFPLLIPPSAASSTVLAATYAIRGDIDPVANIARDKVYLFSGTKDETVPQITMNSTRDFFTLEGVAKSNLLYVHTMPAGHAFISPDGGNACGATTAPYVNECKVKGAPYDQPGAILTQIYGTLNPKAQTLSAQPIAFDQKEFGSIATEMADTGYVYIPSSCQASSSTQCAVHVVFHGCLEGAGEVGDAVYDKVGYNEWADSNHIIVLYPQVDKTSSLGNNPEGCWDWWGYTGFDFQTKSGEQLSAVRAMIKRLTGS